MFLEGRVAKDQIVSHDMLYDTGDSVLPVERIVENLECMIDESSVRIDGKEGCRRVD